MINIVQGQGLPDSFGGQCLMIKNIELFESLINNFFKIVFKLVYETIKCFTVCRMLVFVDVDKLFIKEPSFLKNIDGLDFSIDFDEWPPLFFVACHHIRVQKFSHFFTFLFVDNFSSVNSLVDHGCYLELAKIYSIVIQVCTF